MSSSTSGNSCLDPRIKNRPMKVWSNNRQIKKSCMVKDLASLRLIGCERLGIGREKSVRVVLEADGTEVEDDDYFQLLDDNSTFILLTDKEEWSPVSSIKMFSEVLARRNSQDSANGDSDATDGFEAPSGERRAEQLLDQLCMESAYKNLLPWLLMRPVDLEEIVNADPQSLYSKYSRQVVDEIQEMSSKALNDYNSAQKAVELLNLYDQAARRKVP